MPNVNPIILSQKSSNFAATYTGQKSNPPPDESSLRYHKLIEKQKNSDEQNGSNKSVASDAEWASAWREKEEFYRVKNLRKESHSSPEPLLLDKISSLPPGSAERRHLEVLKDTLSNTAANVGSGLDAMTRESYKETKRIIKHSEMLQIGLTLPLPNSDEVTGEEQGQQVSSLQSWVPKITNAVKPISDAVGSHADTGSSLLKSQAGPDQFLSTSMSAGLDRITSQFTNEANTAFASIQTTSMQYNPSKSSGSLDHLAHSSSNCSIPFEIASDTYGGLLKMMDQIANFADLTMNAMNLFSLTPLGGLKDGIFPIGKLGGFLKPIMNLAGKLGDLHQMLNGFTAIKSLAGAISSIGSNLSSLLTNPLKLAAMLVAGANVASIVGGLAGKKVRCASAQLNLDISPLGVNLNLNITTQLDSVIKSTSKKGKALGNLGFVLGGGVNKNIGKLTLNIRNPQQILAGIMPPEITKALRKLNKLNNLGMVGNLGFSVGISMDSLANSSFSESMSKFATHASIIGPMFNKQTKSVGSYSQEPSLDRFNESSFVKGGQGNKGITMHGPGATVSQKVFI